MSKTLGAIFRSVYGPVTGLIVDGKQGFLKGIENAAVAAAAITNPYILTAYIGSAIAGSLKGTPKPEQTEQALKSAIPVRVSGYGEGRHYIAYSLFTRDHHDAAIDVGAFHDGQVDSIIQHYLGDVKVTLGAGGYVNTGEAGQFGDGNKIYLGVRLGLPAETAFAEVIAQIPEQWTTDHRGDGVVTAFVISKSVPQKNFAEVYPSGGPNQMPLSLAMRRQLCFDWRDETQDVDDPTTWKYTENAVLHLAHYELVRDHKDWATHFLPTIDYWTAAADDADLPVPLGRVQAILNVAANDGDASVTLSSVLGLAIGMDITISATGDTSLTETRTVNGVSGATVSFSGGLANSHPLGSQVTWESDGGAPATEPRYRSCVAHKHTDPHKGVIANLLAAFDGWMAPRSDGALVVYSGRYYEPTVTIGPDQIVSYSLQDGIDEEQAVNSIAVTYVSANHDYNLVDCDPWEDTDDIAARGKLLTDTSTDQVPSYTQARRLTKRKMARIMAPYRGTTTTNAGGRIAIGQRYIRQALPPSEADFDRTVEIIKLTRNMATGGVTYQWIAADPNIDAWNPATEEGLPAPVGNRIAPEPLEPPVITTATPNYGADSSTGAPGVFIDLIVAGPDRDDLTWFARTRQTGAITWGERQYTDIDPDTTVEIATEFVPIDSSVEVEVAYQVGDGRISAWSALQTVSTSSASIPPARVTGLSAAGGAGTATVSWNNPTSGNFAKTRLYHGTTSTFGAATIVGADQVGTAGLPDSRASSETAGVRYFWIASVSTGGAVSAPVGPVSATVT